MLPRKPGATLGGRLTWAMAERGYATHKKPKRGEGTPAIDLAKRAQIDQSEISRWKGDRRPEFEKALQKLGRLAKALNVSFEWLALGEGEPFGPPPDPTAAEIKNLAAEIHRQQGSMQAVMAHWMMLMGAATLPAPKGEPEPPPDPKKPPSKP